MPTYTNNPHSNPQVDEEASLAAQYKSLETFRNIYTQRAEASAEITIPFLFPQVGSTSATDYDTPYQSIGAQGVNGLSAKLLLALLPPNAPFFRLTIDEVKAGKEGIDATMKQELDKALASLEREILKEIEVMGFRNSLYQALRQLTLSGNVLIQVREDSARVYTLRDYVVERDPVGNPVRIITCEEVGIDVVDEAIKAAALRENDGATTVKLYTIAKRDGKKWTTYQELNDDEVEGSRGTYKDGELPYMALRWSKIDGEHYGRGYVEEYIGDLNSAEGLSKAVLEGAAAAARIIFLVDPNSQTNIRDLAETPNGGFAVGQEAAVKALQVGKQADMSVAMEVLEGLRDKLSQAFLSGASGVRNAERVTAAEIRLITRELESALGGLYSVLATELQLPLVAIMIARFKRKGLIGDLPKEIVKPAIVTGIDALGRGQDAQNLDELLAGSVQLFGEQAIQQINLSEYMKRKATALNVDPENLIKSEQDVADEKNQQTMQETAQSVAPQVVGGISQQAQAQAQQQ